MAGLQNVAEQAKQFWATRNGRQRTILIGGGVLTALMLLLFVKFIGTPDYKTLYTGLDPEDVQSVNAKLDAASIPHQTSADGKTISVPADKLSVARMESASGNGPHSGHMGFELFDKMSWGQTEFDEKVNYQRALEGELERSIETLSDVESARVHLVMPSDSVFLDSQRGAKASVVLKLRRGTLSKGAVLAISRLVAGAVDDLKPEDVSIVDADTDRALNIASNSDDGNGGDLTSRLINTLEPIVGAGKIRATVNVEYNRGSTDESQEKYDPTVSAVLSDQKSEDVSGGSPVPGGVPGTASNVPKAKQQQKAAAAPTVTQSSKTDNAQYGVNKTVVHIVTPAGQIERITAAILVDDAIVKTVQKGKVSYVHRKRTTEELNQIKQLAQAAIGFNAQRGDQISVENLPFDADAADFDAPAPTWSTQVQKTITDYSPLLRPISLLLLFVLAYMFLIRPVQKHVLLATGVPSGAPPLLPAARVEALPGATSETIDGVTRVTHLKEQTAEMVRQKPLHTARAVQAWLHEDPS